MIVVGRLESRVGSEKFKLAIKYTAIIGRVITEDKAIIRFHSLTCCPIKFCSARETVFRFSLSRYSSGPIKSFQVKLWSIIN